MQDSVLTKQLTLLKRERGGVQLVLLFMPDCSFNIFFEGKTGKGHVSSQGILKGQKSALENSLLLC